MARRTATIAAVVVLCVGCGEPRVAGGQDPTSLGPAELGQSWHLPVDIDAVLTSGVAARLTASGFPPRTPVGAAQCVVDINDVEEAGLDDCDLDALGALSRSDDDGRVSTEFMPRRWIRVAGRSVDCSEPDEHCAVVVAAIDVEGVDIVHSGGRMVTVDGADRLTAVVEATAGGLEITLPAGSPAVDVRQCPQLYFSSVRSCERVAPPAKRLGPGGSAVLPLQATVGALGLVVRCVPPAEEWTPPENGPAALPQTPEIAESPCFVLLSAGAEHLRIDLGEVELSSASGGPAEAHPDEVDITKPFEVGPDHVRFDLAVAALMPPGSLATLSLCESARLIASFFCTDQLELRADGAGRLSGQILLSRSTPSSASRDVTCDGNCVLVLKTSRGQYLQALEPSFELTDAGSGRLTLGPGGPSLVVEEGPLPARAEAIIDTPWGEVRATTDGDGRLVLPATDSARWSQCRSERCVVRVRFEEGHLGPPLPIAVGP